MRSRSITPPPDYRRRARSVSPSQYVNLAIVPDLIPLPDIGVELVDINNYPELLNEPYSYEPDSNDQRPEFTVSRPLYLFSIGKDLMEAKIGSEFIEEGSSDIGVYERLPVKASTNFSVLNVYDTYGLAVTYAFLDHIYHTKFYEAHTNWLTTYLRTSFQHIITPAPSTWLPHTKDPKSAAYYAITSILLQLVLREQKMFKPDFQLQRMALPPEIVGRITRSERVSKAVGKTARQVLCSSLPRPEDVSGMSSYRGTHRRNVQFLSMESIVSVDDDKFVVYTIERGLGDGYFIMREEFDDQPELYGHGEGVLVAESLHSYYATFSRRRCDGAAGVELLLSDLERRLGVVTDQNVTETAGWIVQLLADLDSGPDVEGEYTKLELGELLSELIREARQGDWSSE